MNCIPPCDPGFSSNLTFAWWWFVPRARIETIPWEGSKQLKYSPRKVRLTDIERMFRLDIGLWLSYKVWTGEKGDLRGYVQEYGNLTRTVLWVSAGTLSLSSPSDLRLELETDGHRKMFRDADIVSRGSSWPSESESDISPRDHTLIRCQSCLKM